MKKVLITLFVCLLSYLIEAQTVTIPDFEYKETIIASNVNSNNNQSSHPLFPQVVINNALKQAFDIPSLPVPSKTKLSSSHVSGAFQMMKLVSDFKQRS